MTNKSIMSGISPDGRDEPGLAERNASVSSKLRQLYETVQNEAVPSRLLDLLDQLDRVETSAKPTDTR